jgi:hypothetical protein
MSLNMQMKAFKQAVEAGGPPSVLGAFLRRAEKICTMLVSELRQ